MKTYAEGTGGQSRRVAIIEDSERYFGLPPTIRHITITGLEGGATTCASSNYPEPIAHNRDERKNRQPFYRGLKKYRKF